METIKSAISRNQVYLNLSAKDIADEDDLEDVGCMIMTNTSIKRFDLKDFRQTDLAKYHLLFQGISQNKSLETIHICRCDVCEELSLVLLSKNISKLHFHRCNITVDIFAVASRTKKYLSHVSFASCMFMPNEDEKPTKRAKVESCDGEVLQREVLFRCDVRVKELRVSGYRMSDDVSNQESVQNEQNLIRFASALPNLTLHELQLLNIHINANVARALSYGISQSKTIEILELGNLAATEDGPNLMISGLDLTSSLKTLNLGGGLHEHITDNVMLSLANTLANRSTLEELKFDNCTAVTSIGWLELSRALGSSCSSLKKLELLGTSIDDNVITALVNELSRNTTLEVLVISCHESRPITSQGWLGLSRLFGSNLSNLREFDISDNGIDDDTIISFINELSQNENSLLKRFIIRVEEGYLGSDPPIDPANDIWDSIMNLLCNTSSVDATYFSNHALCSLGGFVVEELDEYSDDDDSDIFEFEMPLKVYDLLEMNEDDDKKQVARKKIIKHHFSGDFNLNALIGSDQKLLPHKISWFGRDALGLSVVFSIMKKLPELCQN